MAVTVAVAVAVAAVAAVAGGCTARSEHTHQQEGRSPGRHPCAFLHLAQLSWSGHRDGPKRSRTLSFV